MGGELISGKSVIGEDYAGRREAVFAVRAICADVGVGALGGDEIRPPEGAMGAVVRGGAGAPSTGGDFMSVKFEHSARVIPGYGFVLFLVEVVGLDVDALF